MDSVLKWFVRIWIGLAIFANVLGVAGIVVTSPTLWDAWVQITEIWSPFNVINVIAEVVLLLPAIGAHFWLEKRRKREFQVATRSIP